MTALEIVLSVGAILVWVGVLIWAVRMDVDLTLLGLICVVLGLALSNTVLGLGVATGGWLGYFVAGTLFLILGRRRTGGRT